MQPASIAGKFIESIAVRVTRYDYQDYSYSYIFIQNITISVKSSSIHNHVAEIRLLP